MSMGKTVRKGIAKFFRLQAKVDRFAFRAYLIEGVLAEIASLVEDEGVKRHIDAVEVSAFYARLANELERLAKVCREIAEVVAR